MEAINEGDGGLLGDFRLNIFAKRSGPENAEILPLASAVLIRLDRSDQQIVSKWDGGYFSSIVLAAIGLIYN
jgi:hypothetical protein